MGAASSAGAAALEPPPQELHADWQQLFLQRFLHLKMSSKGSTPDTTTPLARSFLQNAVRLPAVEPRTVWRTPDKKNYFTRSQADALSSDARAALKELTRDESYEYTTRVGSPVPLGWRRRIVRSCHWSSATHDWHWTHPAK